MTCAKISKLINPAADESSATEILGSAQDVIFLSTCAVHPQLIRGAFGSNFETGWPSTTTIKIGRLSKSRHQVWLCAEKPPQHPDLPPSEIKAKTRIQPVGSQNARLIEPNGVDGTLLRRWRSLCELNHGVECNNCSLQLVSAGPTWLVDTWLQRIVSASPKDSYIALSYVWGQDPFYKTTKANIAQLQ